MHAWLVLALLLAGCVGTSTDDVDPRVSVTYSKSSQSQDGVTRGSISATMTYAHGIDDRADLDVCGCAARSSGPVETPYKFRDCTGRSTITFMPTGEVLYRSQ